MHVNQTRKRESRAGRSNAIVVLSVVVTFASSFAQCDESNRYELTEISIEHSAADLSNQYGNWRDYALSAAARFSKGDWVRADASRQTHFSDTGYSYGASLLHNTSPRWFTILGVGSSEGGFFLPQLRADASIGKKWLDESNLVTVFGYTYSNAKDIHRDVSAQLSIAYYSPKSWVLEYGARSNGSFPGPIIASRSFVVFTYGRNHQYYATARYESGREAYSLVNDTQHITNYSSTEATVKLKAWVIPDFGFQASASYYFNPYYQRRTYMGGVFVEF